MTNHAADVPRMCNTVVVKKLLGKEQRDSKWPLFSGCVLKRRNFMTLPTEDYL